MCPPIDFVRRLFGCVSRVCACGMLLGAAATNFTSTGSLRLSEGRRGGIGGMAARESPPEPLAHKMFGPQPRFYFRLFMDYLCFPDLTEKFMIGFRVAGMLGVISGVRRESIFELEFLIKEARKA